ncbi:MAG TPA: hypothetical protein PK431_01650 [Chitinophagales bacterium]|nr:hypothetical protein [Chitinophagales bacterium]
MAFRKTFTISDESLNTYGFWLLTSGAKLDNFKLNAPCFYDHQTYDLPVGHWENIRVEGTLLKADLVIDGKNEREIDIIRKIENGDIKGASVGFDPITLSEDEKYLKKGQRRPTAIEWEPFEASVTPLPANLGTLLLGDRKNGVQLRATQDGDNINQIIPTILNQQKQLKMDKIAKALGLSADANESVILDALSIVLTKSAQTETLSKHVEELAKETLDEPEHKFFVELNKTNPAQALDFLKLNRKDVAAAEATVVVSEEGKVTPVTAVTKLSDVLAEVKKLGKLNNEEGAQDDKTSYDYLQRHNPKELARIKNTDPDKFKELQDAYILSRKK